MMFLLNSQVCSQEKFRSKKNRPAVLAHVILALALVLSAAFITGCSNDLQPEDDSNYYGSLPDGLIGKWTTSYDYYLMEKTTGMGTVSYHMDGGDIYDPVTFEVTGTYDAVDTKGDIMYVSNFDSNSGVIIIKYTDFPYYGDPARPFHVYYYMNFIPGVSVEIYDTWDASDANQSADTATLSAAVKNFTRGKRGNYADLSFHPVYEKQP
ncbi:MAG: hypothetical protein FWD78_13870 [Treponema sp.]|nr:hypothetical protein [Treponema sp.]